MCLKIPILNNLFLVWSHCVISEGSTESALLLERAVHNAYECTHTRHIYTRPSDHNRNVSTSVGIAEYGRTRVMSYAVVRK